MAMKKGFTLIETMIAVTVITFSVAGPLFTASRSIIAAQIARDQLTASYLAQEGIEYVRAMRDDAYLHAASGADASATAWADFLSGSSSWSITGCVATGCLFDPTRAMGTGGGLALQPCSGGACTPLYLANNIYTQQNNLVGAVPTPFTRTIQASAISATDERIVSTVSWSFKGTPHSITITDHLTPWQ